MMAGRWWPMNDRGVFGFGLFWQEVMFDGKRLVDWAS